MQQAVREITEMAERLETSGLQREQGDAVIQAIASSIEKFAVTPEILGQTIDQAFERADERQQRRIKAFDQRLGERIEHLHKLSDERFEQFSELMSEKFMLVHQEVRRTNERLDRHDRRFDGIDAKLNPINGGVVTLLAALVGTLASAVARGTWL